jgi:hypothetical protein
LKRDNFEDLDRSILDSITAQLREFNFADVENGSHAFQFGNLVMAVVMMFGRYTPQVVMHSEYSHGPEAIEALHKYAAQKLAAARARTIQRVRDLMGDVDFHAKVQQQLPPTSPRSRQAMPETRSGSRNAARDVG